MPKIPTFNSLHNLKIEEVDLDSIFNSLVKDISDYLGIKPRFLKYTIALKNKTEFSEEDTISILDIGVYKYNLGSNLIININKKYLKILPIILLRECYYLFIEESGTYVTLKKLIINQIIINDLSDFEDELLEDWSKLIKTNIENIDLISTGTHQLSEFERMGSFFRLKRGIRKFDPVRYFFRHSNEFNFNRDEGIHQTFTEKFHDYSLRSIENNNQIIETIYSIICIFYEVKKYRNLLSYKEYFKKFKGNILKTELSLRNFIQGMNWVKYKSLYSPSYQLIYNSINIGVFVVVFKFNPQLKRKNIFKILKSFPFFISPKLTFNGFSTHICGYVILPKIYIEDFKSFLEKIKSKNYLMNFYSQIRIKQDHVINLNYFMDSYQDKRIINPNYKNYLKKYEIRSQVKFGEKFYEKPLSTLDFLLLDRIRFHSISGFGFERRSETLSILKSDLLSLLKTKHSIILDLKEILKKFQESKDFRQDIIKLIRINEKFGFFFIKEQIEDSINIIELLEKKFIENQEITNLNQIQRILENENLIDVIEESLLLQKENLLITIIRQFINKSLNFKSDYKKKVKNYYLLKDFLNICHQLKIFRLNTIIEMMEKPSIVSHIFDKKQEDLKILREKYKIYKISMAKIENKFDEFLSADPPIIIPNMINTIPTTEYEDEYLQVILKISKSSKKILNHLKGFFPRFLIYLTKCVISEQNFYYTEISIPRLSKKEKKIFLSFLKNCLKEEIIYIKSYIWSGFIPGFTNRNFYDFTKKQFFYTPDLFEQYFLYVKNTFPRLSDLPEEKNQTFQENMWDQVENFETLIEEVEKNDYARNLNFSIDYLNKLVNFDMKLKEILLDDEKYMELKNDFFFQNYIDSIDFLPAFSKFNLEQFYLYIYPFDLGEIDYRLLFTNSFQEVQYPAKIGKSNSLLIRYLMPFRAPNLSYINWITKSKRAIREYCAFSMKKIYTIFHTNFNLTPDGWDYSADKFKVHMQKVLFDPKYKIKIPELKEFDVSKILEAQRFGKHTPEFKSLTQIYDTDPIDIKSHLGTKRYPTIKNIKTLLEKNLIFPYISFKNLALNDEIHLILPKVKSVDNQKLLKIFSYFNLAHIYQIQGEFFIYGFNEEIHFENGLFIKLFFPKCELSEFFKIFDKLFDYLDIDHYIILHDLVDGKNLLKSIYGSLDFLDSYNPLLNFEWSEKDKKWINHKLFGYKFEPNYPNLNLKEGV